MVMKENIFKFCKNISPIGSLRNGVNVKNRISLRINLLLNIKKVGGPAQTADLQGVVMLQPISAFQACRTASSV